MTSKEEGEHWKQWSNDDVGRNFTVTKHRQGIQSMSGVSLIEEVLTKGKPNSRGKKRKLKRFAFPRIVLLSSCLSFRKSREE